MLIPCGTDAPLYRPPWGTLALILANSCLFLLQDNVTPESIYILEFGNGLHPVQWLASAFAHADPMHLIGNMIFLLSFGMVVESMMKLRHFLLLYFAIAILESIIVQTMMLGASSGGALGASGAIYGLMMVATICAPGKNIRWIWLYYYSRYTSLEVPVMINGVYYFMFDFGLAMFSGFAISTPLLHAIGALVGIGLGVVAYRLNLFLLDGEDLWSRAKEAFGGEPAVPPIEKTVTSDTLKRPVRTTRHVDQRQQVSKLEHYLAGRHYPLAVMKLTQIQRQDPGFRLTERQLIQLVNLGTERQQWAATLAWIDDYCQTYTRHTTRLRLNKARIQLVKLNDPVAAAETLQAIVPALLQPTERTFFDKLQKRIDRAEKSAPGIKHSAEIKFAPDA